MNKPVMEMSREEVEAALNRIPETAHGLLSLCGMDDDPDNALRLALKALMRAADDVHESVVLEVLVAQCGIDTVRSWMGFFGRRIRKAAKQD